MMNESEANSQIIPVWLQFVYLFEKIAMIRWKGGAANPNTKAIVLATKLEGGLIPKYAHCKVQRAIRVCLISVGLKYQLGIFRI